MQLASESSIPCIIQYLAQQQSQHKILWSMLWNWTFPHFCQANMSNWPNTPHDNNIGRIKVRAAWRQTKSDRLRHCPAYDAKRNLRRGTVNECTCWGNQIQSNWSTIIWREKPLEQKASWRHRDSNYGGAGKYETCWKRRIEIQKAWDNIWGDVQCCRRGSKR